MVTHTQDFDQLLSEIQRREHSSGKSAALWTIVPAILALVLLAYSSERLATASRKVATLQETASTYEAQATTLRQEVTGLRTQISTLNSEVSELRIELEAAEQQLKQTLDLSQYRHDVSFVDLKLLFSRYPKETEMLETILALRRRDVGWKLGGETPESGFDSPSFAEYILRRSNLSGGSPEGTPLLAASRRLFQTLPPIAEPEVGDIVFYPAGFAMFYFRDRNNQPFVIGMTPTGIAALEPDFAKAIGYRRPIR